MRDYVSEILENRTKLGLNKHVQKKFNDVDAIENVSWIQFKDKEAELICHEHGVYTIEDAAKVTSIMINEKTSWFDRSSIKSFNEFKYFTGLKEIKEYSFYRCYSLQSINIPNSVTIIRAWAFICCESLQSINILDGVTRIESGAFDGCTSLKSVTLPNTISIIGKTVFSGCQSLQSVNIPDSVKSIGSAVFWGCSSLQSIIISKNCPVYNQIRKAYSDIQLVEPKVNESSSLGLNKHVQKKFQDIDAIENVSWIPFEDKEVEHICHEHGVYTVDDAAQVTSIINSGECTGWFYKSSIIKSFNEFKYFTGLGKIEQYSFFYCCDLQSITLPDNITCIGDQSFYGCRSLKTFNIPDSVTKIGTTAFYRCRSLQSIDIPDSVKTIGDGAFGECYSLQSVRIPDYISYFHEYTISRCDSLKTIYISKHHPLLSYIKNNKFIRKCNCKFVDPNEVNESHLGLNKHVQKKYSETSVEDAAENLVEVDADMITKLYDMWGHVTTEYQEDILSSYTGKIFTFGWPNNLDTKIGKSYEKFISDMTDGEMRFTHNNRWGQENLDAIEFWDYRVRKNIRSRSNCIYCDPLYYPEYKKRFLGSTRENMILDWFIPATVKVLKEHPEFRTGFLRKLRK